MTGFCLPNGEIATPAQIQADCDAWATSFARDQRSSFVQNHDHDCTGTCIKYEKKKQDATGGIPQRAGQKIGGSAVFKCRFRYFRYVALTIAAMIRYVVRRGRDLVQQPYVATGNDENEYGKAIVERSSPTRSSSQDVLQATVRSNADYQYQKRAVPEESTTETDAETAAGAATEPRGRHKFFSRLLCGCQELTQPQNERILAGFATAMRAANVADFYMTKYLSKAQQALSDVMQPLTAGLRRAEETESAPDAGQTTVKERARRRILRLIFSANRTLWFSACELGVFLATGSSCVKSEPNMKTFSGRGMAMMHECKRLLNHGAGDHGLLFAARVPDRGGAASMSVFVVPRTTEHEAAPHDNNAASGVAARQDSATEQALQDSNAAGSDDEDNAILPDGLFAHDAQGMVPTGTEKTILFTKGTSHRDDWLHRGADLQDLDYYHYSRYVERLEKPRHGTAADFQRRRGRYRHHHHHHHHHHQQQQQHHQPLK